jgi:hypothetical protein
MFIFRIAFLIILVILFIKPELVFILYKSIIGIPFIKVRNPGPLSLLAFST